MQNLNPFPQQKLRLKVTYKGETRAIILSKGNWERRWRGTSLEYLPTYYCDFVGIISDIFSNMDIMAHPCVIKYLDNDDLIIISNDREMKEAFNFGFSQPGSSLKVFVNQNINLKQQIPALDSPQAMSHVLQTLAEVIVSNPELFQKLSEEISSFSYQPLSINDFRKKKEPKNFLKRRSFENFGLRKANSVPVYNDNSSSFSCSDDTVEERDGKIFKDITFSTDKEPRRKPNKIFQNQKLQEQKKLLGRFVGDVTIPDNTIMEPGQLFVKTWRIKNDSKVNIWPKNTSIMFVGGDNIAIDRETKINVPSAAPKGIVDVSVAMRAPKKAGRYISYWRLASENSKFGQRLWVDILVKDPSENFSKKGTDEVYVSAVAIKHEKAKKIREKMLEKQEKLQEKIILKQKKAEERQKRIESKRQQKLEERKKRLLVKRNPHQENSSEEEIIRSSSSSPNCEQQKQLVVSKVESVSQVIQVAPQINASSNSVAVQTNSKKEENAEIMESIHLLKEMGFTDEPKILQLLKKFKSDLVQVVQALLE